MEIRVCVVRSKYSGQDVHDLERGITDALKKLSGELSGRSLCGMPEHLIVSVRRDQSAKIVIDGKTGKSRRVNEFIDVIPTSEENMACIESVVRAIKEVIRNLVRTSKKAECFLDGTGNDDWKVMVNIRSGIRRIAFM